MMTPVVCKFDRSCDLHDVDQFGFVDLHQVLETGVVPGSVAFSDESFNGVIDTDILMSRPRDRFEALRQRSYVRSALAAVSENSDTGHGEPTTE